MQPPGLIEALRPLDAALALAERLRALGARVTLARNRLVHDAVNLVFGAEHEFDPTLLERWSCIIVNLEPLGPGAPALDPGYLALLQSAPVLDCDAAHFADPSAAPLLKLADAPWLRASAAPRPLPEREFDVLLPDRLGERGRRLLAELRGAGLAVSAPDTVMVGPERDALVRNARLVLVPHEAGAARFDPVPAATWLALGTPVVAERGPGLRVTPEFEATVFWCRPDETLARVRRHVRDPAFASEAAAKLAAWSRVDANREDQRLLEGAAALWQAHRSRRDAGPWRPERINIGSGRDYIPGWLNLDVLERAQPDALLDLGRPVALPLTLHSRFVGPVELAVGSVGLIYASNVLEHIPDLALAFTQALRLLRVGGEFHIEVPHERSPGAWQDPTHVRAMNENSWLYPTRWFWYLGWLEHRFELAELSYVDLELEPCAAEAAHFMRVRLVKVETTVAERAHARSMQADFGGLLTALDPSVP